MKGLKVCVWFEGVWFGRDESNLCLMVVLKIIEYEKHDSCQRVL